MNILEKLNEKDISIDVRYYGLEDLSTGIKVKELLDGKDIILEIDTQGALQVKKQMPESVLIFICPPSLEDLEKRLRGRHTEDEATIQKRLNAVKEELARAENFDYKIVNDDLDNAISELERIINGEHEKC